MDVRRHIVPATAVVALLVLGILYFLFLSPPAGYPSGNIIVIDRGASVAAIATELKSAGVIQDPSAFRIILRYLYGGRVQAGPYLFKSPQNALYIAYRLSRGEFEIPPVKITFPEGLTIRDMAERVTDAFPLQKAADFIAAAKGQEGYLFPDTYIFNPDATASAIVKAMRDNFDAKISSIQSDIRASGRSLSDIVILASLIEKEARTTENRKLVAGVLLNRLNIGMPLQVDAVFGYIHGRDTYSPSLDDLKVNSPYNTYTHAGLPPGPIDNPGMDSILAVIHPAPTTYLYYLTDKNGVMHYSTTYATHQANQAKYLH